MNETKKRHNRKLIFIPFLSLFYFLFVPCFIQAQDSTLNKKEPSRKKNILVGALYEYGYIFPSVKFLQGDNLEHMRIDKYQSFSARIMFQNSGREKNPWYQLYGYPYLGLGVWVSDFYDIREMGVPIAIYGFINGPFHRWNNLTFRYEIDLGMTGNWRHFNPVSNKYNIAIGAERTVFIHLGIGLAYRFSPHWEAELNMGVAHFSNGAIKVPNWGLNTFSPRMEVRYNIHGNAVLKEYEQPPFKRIMSLEITPFVAIKNVVMLDSVDVNTIPDYQGVYFPVYGLRTTFNWQISHKSKFGVGMALTYDESKDFGIAVENGKLILKRLPLLHGIRASIYPSYELVIGPFSLLFQPGIYIYRQQYHFQVPEFYQRIGFKYTLAHHVTFGFSLRAYNFQVSEFIEWGVGYQFNWMKK